MNQPPTDDPLAPGTSLERAQAEEIAALRARRDGLLAGAATSADERRALQKRITELDAARLGASATIEVLGKYILKCKAKFAAMGQEAPE